MKWPLSLSKQIQTGTHVDQPVELRDFLPTFLQVAGGEVPADMDGQSLLHLVTGKQQEWRKYIDMEHATCYSPDNYWCALTDGKIKYIWFMYTGEEQLFDLVKDPGEERNVAQAKPYQKQLAEMRQAMVRHLSERGDGFVKDGQLVKREQTLLYSPHYPQRGCVVIKVYGAASYFLATEGGIFLRRPISEVFPKIFDSQAVKSAI